MNPQLLELPVTIVVAITAYAAWRGQRQARAATTRDRNGRRREIWDEVEGLVNSIEVRDGGVVIAYEFLTAGGSYEAQHRFDLELPKAHSSADADRAAQRYLIQYQVGRPARVRYNPKNVAECVLARPRSQQAAASSKAVQTTA
jgi:hypothetical protein